MLVTALAKHTRQTLEVYWMLVRIMVPIAILTEILARTGVIRAAAPGFAPIMNLVGLPPELGLAWLTGIFVGIWGAVALIFALVPVGSLSTADITVFSALILFVHGLPMEQKIIQKAGPGIIATTILRVAGGLAYGVLLHQIFTETGWLADPVKPAWIPLASTPDWTTYFLGLAKTMVSMFAILVALSWGLAILKATGLLRLTMKALSPLLRLAGIRGEAGHLTAIGLFLGISYGAGLLIQEARSGALPPRQIFLSCVFMGFAHSIIEDTLLMLSLGADAYSILIGRMVFAIAATALVAALLQKVSERTFSSRMYRAAEAS